MEVSVHIRVCAVKSVSYNVFKEAAAMRKWSLVSRQRLIRSTAVPRGKTKPCSCGRVTFPSGETPLPPFPYVINAKLVRKWKEKRGWNTIATGRVSPEKGNLTPQRLSSGLRVHQARSNSCSAVLEQGSGDRCDSGCLLHLPSVYFAFTQNMLGEDTRRRTTFPDHGVSEVWNRVEWTIRYESHTRSKRCRICSSIFLKSKLTVHVCLFLEAALYLH